MKTFLHSVWIHQWGHLLFWLTCLCLLVSLGLWVPLTQGRLWFRQRAAHKQSQIMLSRTQKDQFFWHEMDRQTSAFKAELEQNLKLIKPQEFLALLENITQKQTLVLNDLQISDESSKTSITFSWQGSWQATMSGLYDLETLPLAIRISNLRLTVRNQDLLAHITLVFWNHDDAI